MPQTSPLIPFVAGYSTPDGFRHAIAATNGGKLHEIFFKPTGKGNARLACFDAITTIDSFFTSDDGYQHEIVATPDGNVHEIYFKPNDINFTEPPLGHFNGILDIAAFQALDDKNRIVIVATNDGSLHEIFYHPSLPGGGHVSTLALPKFNGIVGIAAFYTPDDKFRHVIVATGDGNVHEVFYHPSIGVHLSQPPLAKFNGVVGVGAFYAEDDKNRIVIVATNDGLLHEIFYRPSLPGGGHVSTLGVPKFNHIIGVAAFYTPDDKFRHAIVATDDGNVHEVFYHPSIGAHLSTPPLAHFPHPSPLLEDISPDPGNLDAKALGELNQGLNSTAGRTVSIAGDEKALYAFSQLAGVWKSVTSGPWMQMPQSPLEAKLFGPSSLAVDPNDSSHVVAGNAEGVWESKDGASNWTFVLNPTKQNWANCASSVINAVAFGPDSTLYLGIDCGIVRRPPNGAFTLTPVPAAVTALAVSQTKIWARTTTSILFSSNKGAQWSPPVPTPNGVTFGANQVFSLAAFDAFAFLTFSKGGDGGCGASNWLLIFNAGTQGWTTQRVDFQMNATCDGTGGEVNGRKFVKAFMRKDPNLAMTVGQRLQFFYGAGQEIYQALGMNSNGTMTQWSRIAGTKGPGFTNQDPVHADMWDFHIDVSVGGRTAWIAGDGGVYLNKLANPYTFPGGGWGPVVPGMHTHEVHTVTALPTTPVSRSRLVYATSDNNTWYRGSTPIVMPEPSWQLDGTLGDANWTAGDAAAPRFALTVRHQESAVFIHYGGTPELVFCRLINGGEVKPDVPTRFRFIPSPQSAGHFSTVDAVMMVDLPLLIFDQAQNKLVPISPNLPLGQNSNGKPVLIRNKTFNTNPDINTSKGAGWEVEIPSLPSSTSGFYVTGSRSAPRYYAFTQFGELFRRDGNNWTSVAKSLVSSPQFGPAFVNPYDQNMLYALAQNTVLLSTNGGNTFNPDPALTALAAGVGKLPMSTIAEIAFNRANPAEVAMGAESGLFFGTNGKWTDLTALLPRPRSKITSVAIDCEAIYVGTDARSVLRIVDYKGT